MRHADTFLVAFLGFRLSAFFPECLGWCSVPATTLLLHRRELHLDLFDLVEQMKSFLEVSTPASEHLLQILLVPLDCREDFEIQRVHLVLEVLVKTKRIFVGVECCERECECSDAQGVRELC